MIESVIKREKKGDRESEKERQRMIEREKKRRKAEKEGRRYDVCASERA